MYAASSMSKGCARGVLLGPDALAVLCRGCCKEALKKGLMRFAITMKPQVKAIEVTLLKGFGLKGFLRFVTRMWHGRAERVNARC